MDLREVTRRDHRAVDAGDLTGVVEWSAEDGVHHRPGYAPMRGRDALRPFYGGRRRSYLNNPAV